MALSCHLAAAAPWTFRQVDGILLFTVRPNVDFVNTFRFVGQNFIHKSGAVWFSRQQKMLGHDKFSEVEYA